MGGFRPGGVYSPCCAHQLNGSSTISPIGGLARATLARGGNRDSFKSCECQNHQWSVTEALRPGRV